MEALKLLSMLLDYPGEEMRAWLAAPLGHETTLEMLRRLDREALLEADEYAAVAAFIERQRGLDPTDQESEYVQTFDMTPEHSLHLTHHLFSDDNDRNRGPALIDLGELYKDYGVQVAANELPDYLPLVLEFVAMLDESEGTAFLADAHKVLKVLADNLSKTDSPYAPLLAIIKDRATLTRLNTLAIPTCLAA